MTLEEIEAALKWMDRGTLSDRSKALDRPGFWDEAVRVLLARIKELETRNLRLTTENNVLADMRRLVQEALSKLPPPIASEQRGPRSG